ncbi:hypothetical protein [Kitasatospora sp. NPDC097643]|uniref:hypothetical protein n=1 Tax=Kitasatospora sp. NPDC097643 TaxID=3157230 RepID=UPI00331D12D9
MTRYCVDPVRCELTATWGTSEGDLTARIAVLPADTDLGVVLRLARGLTGLSEAAWRTYTHPASAAGSLESNTEGWRREQERKGFAEVPEAVVRPNLPHGGTLTVSPSTLVESAHRIGRALHTLDNADLAAAVLAETAAELAAVESAELGDLTGRARQAALLSRQSASPVQVAAADRLFEEDPFGTTALFADIDPTAASVAAAHWLAAAAEVSSAACGHSLTSVAMQAEGIEAMMLQTPILVLEFIEAGVSPYNAVTGLVHHALHIADGLLPDPAGLREQLVEFDEEIAERLGEGPIDPEDTGLRLTPLDPKRPARDLLEDLLSGIHSCWLLHSAYTNGSGPDSADSDSAGPDERADPTGAEAEQRQAESRHRFALLTREAAARHADRLT